MASIDPKTTADERSAVLQRRVQELTKLYESEAYRAYNLALRIACEPEPAGAATEQAFLSAAEEKDPPAALTLAIVRNALAEARRKPKASGAGGAEAQRLLDAVAKLPASERAAVILATIEQFDGAKIATTLEIPPAAAAQMLERGDERLGRELGVASSQLPALLASWPWAEPPPQLWESLYTRFHSAAQRQLDTAPGAAGRTVAAASAGAGRQPSKRAARRTPSAAPAGPGLLGRLRGLSWRARLAAVAVIAVSAAAFAMVGGDNAGDAATLGQFDASGVDASGTPYSGAENGEGEEEEYDPLTPEELDELRRKEIEDLKRYQKKQSDSSLSDEVRERAAAKAQSLLQKQRGGRSGSGSGTKKKSSGGNKTSGGGGNKSSSDGGKTTPKPAPDPEPAPEPKPKPPPDDTSGGGGSKNNDSGGKDKPKSNNDKSSCLYDEAKQAYICPQ